MYDLNTRVLVVDDMITMRKLVQKALKDIGFKDFVEATDGAKAWEAFSSASPPIGLIISDWNMPNCTGLDFLKRVRSDSRFAKTPFYLVTAESESSQVVEAVKAGVTGYIVKPFDMPTMKTKLEDGSKKAA